MLDDDVREIAGLALTVSRVAIDRLKIKIGRLACFRSVDRVVIPVPRLGITRAIADIRRLVERKDDGEADDGRFATRRRDQLGKIWDDQMPAHITGQLEAPITVRKWTLRKDAGGKLGQILKISLACDRAQHEDGRRGFDGVCR